MSVAFVFGVAFLSLGGFSAVFGRSLSGEGVALMTVSGCWWDCFDFGELS